MAMDKQVCLQAAHGPGNTVSCLSNAVIHPLASRSRGTLHNCTTASSQQGPDHQVTKAEYVKHGSEAMTGKLASDLTAQGRKPYVIPVGGSNSLGCWGYIMAMEEIMQQTADQADKPFTHIVMVRAFAIVWLAREIMTMRRAEP